MDISIFKTITLLALFFVGLLGPARAEAVDEALELYINGQFVRAIELGRATNTVAGMNLAVRSQLIMVQYVFNLEKRATATEMALVDARLAHEMDPENLEAVINLGIILGLKGKYERSISGGKDARDLFLTAVEMDPENSWALGTLASWHSDIIDTAGIIAGVLVFDAGKKRAFEYFDRAIQAEPDNLTIRAAHVRALLKLKPENYSEMVQENMNFILNADPVNALERLMIEQIYQIKAALDENDQTRLKLLLDEAVPLEPAALAE